MSTVTVSPLRQRMIEDMNARKLCAETQRGHIHSCRRFAKFLKHSHDRPTAGGYPPISASSFRDGREHLQSQSHHDRSAVPASRDAAAAGPCRGDLSHPGAAEYSVDDEPGRDAPPAGSGQQSQGSHAVQSRLWLRAARQRGGQVEGQAHRPRTEHHSGRAVQGPQGPPRHAPPRCSICSAMVEGAPIAS